MQVDEEPVKVKIVMDTLFPILIGKHTLLKIESCVYSSEELKWGVKHIGGYGNSSGVAQTLPRITLYTLCTLNFKGGDQMTASRIRRSQRIRSNAERSKEKLLGV